MGATKSGGRVDGGWQAEALLEQALTAVRKRNYDRALVLLTDAIGFDPHMKEAWTLRGNIKTAQGEWFDALLHFDRALTVRNDAYDAWNNRGTCLANLGQWGAAEASFKRSAEIMPARDPHMGLANMYCTLMRLPEAVEQYRAAIAFDQDDYEAHFNLGVTLLGLGLWEEGFAEYQYRWANDPFPPSARRLYPQWKGEDLAGKTILLYAEQGYGDEIMSSRYAILLAHVKGAHVVLETRAPFTRLARCLIQDHGIHVAGRGDLAYDARDASVDFSCALLDVPMITGMFPDQAEMPRPLKYLSAPRGLVEQWKLRLVRSGLNVGLCWGSGRHLSTSPGARQVKSIPIQLLAGLKLSGVNLISLQKPAEPTPPEMEVTDWTDELHDLADTAALIECLDLVITVDTAVAHLAGALGKPVWNLVRFSGYWPWLAPPSGRVSSHSIWYPSMTLYRQPALGDWSTPVNKVINDLKLLQLKTERAA